MKTLSSFALLGTLSLLAVSCHTSAAIGKQSITSSAASRAYLNSYNIPSHGVALEGYCPVAYFAVNKPVRGTPDHAPCMTA